MAQNFKGQSEKISIFSYFFVNKYCISLCPYQYTMFRHLILQPKAKANIRLFGDTAPFLRTILFITQFSLHSVLGSVKFVKNNIKIIEKNIFPCFHFNLSLPQLEQLIASQLSSWHRTWPTVPAGSGPGTTTERRRRRQRRRRGWTGRGPTAKRRRWGSCAGWTGLGRCP